MIDTLGLALIGGAVAGQVFLAAEWTLGSRNAPISDWLLLLLLLLAPLRWWQRQGHSPAPVRHRWLPLVGFLGVWGLAALFAGARQPALHDWLRKGLFPLLTGGLLLPWWLAGRRNLTRRLQLGWIALIALLSLADSLDRIALGELTHTRAIRGLVLNHKTLAVALAPQLPIWFGWLGQRRDTAHTPAPPRRPARDLALLALPLLALGLSFSRTSWIIACLAGWLAWSGRQSAPALRRGRRALVVGALLPLALAGWWLGRSGTSTMSDATRARAALLDRSVSLFRSRPLLGHGPGASVRHRATEWPAFRVNGVEAHGVLQKVAAEGGALGLLAWLAMATALVIGSARRAHDPQSRHAVDSLLLLHLTLLFSTEAFTSSHWIPLGLCLAQLESRPGPRSPTDAAHTNPPGATAGPQASGQLAAGPRAAGLGFTLSAAVALLPLLRATPPSTDEMLRLVARFEEALEAGDRAELRSLIAREGLSLTGAPPISADALVGERTLRTDHGGSMQPIGCEQRPSAAHHLVICSLRDNRLGDTAPILRASYRIRRQRGALRLLEVSRTGLGEGTGLEPPPVQLLDQHIAAFEIALARADEAELAALIHPDGVEWLDGATRLSAPELIARLGDQPLWHPQRCASNWYPPQALQLCLLTADPERAGQLSRLYLLERSAGQLVLRALSAAPADPGAEPDSGPRSEPGVEPDSGPRSEPGSERQ